MSIPLQYATLLTLLIGVVGLAIAFWSTRRQVAVQISFELSARYAEAIRSFAPGVWASRFSDDRSLPSPSLELSAYTQQYLSVVALGYLLRKRRFIGKDVRSLFAARVQRDLRSPLFMREWQAQKVEFAVFPEFAKFVEATQAHRSSAAARTTWIWGVHHDPSHHH